MKRSIILSLSLIMTLGIGAQSYKQCNDICYTAKTDTYSQERLKLDIYYREEAENLPVVVWFHGGGLEQGNKEIPWKLKEKGFVVVGVNYRLLPKVAVRETLDDAVVEATFMMKNGYLNKNDVVGSQSFVDANGDISVGIIINLKNVNFGGLTLTNVRDSVVRNQKAPLLLGQSVLGRLGKIEIDNSSQILKISHQTF